VIGWLGGTVLVRDPTAGEVVIDAGGVGYQVAVSWQTFAQVPEAGARAELFIHTHVREDALALFGFATTAEKRMFRLLTSVPQVGPKMALGVLGGLPLPELCAAISAGERATLERIPGVGKRTAERIILDLKEKVIAVLEGLGGGTKVPAAAPVRGEGLQEEAAGVLVNLGWKPKPVEAALQKVAEDAGEGATLDDLVRRALAVLMGR
jgi:Holliday junction DNA helicase RuvA